MQIQHLRTNGLGDTNDKRKTCSPPTSPADECKQKGGIWDGKRCLSPADALQGQGLELDRHALRRADQPGRECRKKGGMWDGKRCLSPADACKAKGWNWDGKSCKPPAAEHRPADHGPAVTGLSLGNCGAGLNWAGPAVSGGTCPGGADFVTIVIRLWAAP